MTSIRQYAGNVGALIGQSTVQRLLGMLSTVVLARMLGASGFGAYSVVVNTAASAYGMARLGVDASIHVHTAETDTGDAWRQDKGDMLGAGLLLLGGSAVVGATACLALTEWLANTVYGQPQLERWLAFAAGLVLLQCISQFCFTTLAGLHRFIAYSKVMILSAVASTAAVIAGAYSYGIGGALAGMLAAQALTVLLLARSTKGALRASEIVLRLGAVKHWVRRHLRLGLPFYAAGLLAVPAVLYLQGLLSRHAGLEALGELRVITAILTLISFIPVAASSAMISLLTKSSTSDYASFVRQSLLHIKYIWLFAVVSGLVVFLALPYLVEPIFGAAYVGAIGPATYAILSAVIACVLGFSGNIIFARKRVEVILAMTACQFAVFVGAGSALIPRMGLSGYMASELIGNGAALLFLFAAGSSWRTRHQVRSPWLVPGLILSAVNGMGILALSLPGMEDYRPAGALLLLGVTGLAGARYILTGEERAMVKSKVSGVFDV